MRTWLTETLQIEVPVISAPMMGVSGGLLAGAVSAAGGLGMIGAPHGPSAEWIDEQAAIARRSEQPFGIGLVGWSLTEPEELLVRVAKAQPALVSLSFGGDIGSAVAILHDAGIPVATQVGNLDEAHDADAVGVDVIVVRGAEAGGHGRNQVATLPLLQAVLEAIDTPVVAAGGIATARGLAAVLAAGAAGAWIGTAFACATEAATQPEARRAILSAELTDTVYTRVFDLAEGRAWPPEFGGRALANAVTADWAARETELEQRPPALTALSDQVRKAKSDGDVHYSAVYAGQSAGLVESSRPAAEIMADLARADEWLRRAAGTG